MNKVLFIALSFPDVTKTTHLYTDLMHEFLKQGNDVLVIAPDVVGRKNSVLVNESGLKILRVPTMNLFSNNLIEKGLSNILLPRQFKKALKKHNIAMDFDLIMIPTPPISLIDVALWVKNRSKGKLYLILRDIFPQNAVDLKMMHKNSLVHKYFRKKEVKLYKGADSIGCMSPANIAYIKQHNTYLDFSKLHLLPNWENLHPISADFNENEVREQYGLTNKVVAIFGGNIGVPQRMENIINLAEASQDLENLVFFIVGRGTEWHKISDLIAEKGLKNVILKENLPRPDYNKILQIADIGLISLSQDFTIPNYPSKVTAYYALKKPVLASVDNNTDFGRIQEQINCGYWSVAGDTKALKKNLVKLYESESLRKTMGQNGHNFMLNNLLPIHAYKIIFDNL